MRGGIPCLMCYICNSLEKLFYILSFKLTGMPDLTGKPLYARQRMYFFSNFKDFNTQAPAQ